MVFSLYYKRLEEGTFELPAGIIEGTHSSITVKQLSMILQGISLKKAFFRKRYIVRCDPDGFIGWNIFDVAIYKKMATFFILRKTYRVIHIFRCVFLKSFLRVGLSTV